MARPLSMASMAGQGTRIASISMYTPRQAPLAFPFSSGFVSLRHRALSTTGTGTGTCQSGQLTDSIPPTRWRRLFSIRGPIRSECLDRRWWSPLCSSRDPVPPGCLRLSCISRGASQGAAQRRPAGPAAGSELGTEVHYSIRWRPYSCHYRRRVFGCRLDTTSCPGLQWP